MSVLMWLKAKHNCCIVDSDGVIINDSLRICNSSEGFELLYTSILSALSGQDISNVKIGLESTGHYSTNLQNYLYAKGFRLFILNPLATNLFRKAQTLRKTKTDKTDALVIAKMLFSDDTKSYSPVSYQIQELKSLTKLTNILNKSSQGRYGKAKAIEIKEAASCSIGMSVSSLSFELKQTIRLIQPVQTEIDALDAQIKKVVIETNTPLMTIPGISYTLAAIILSEIGDIDRFTTPAKLLAFAGLEPSTYQSGKYNASHTPMVKRGSTYLRWAMLSASRTVTMRDETFALYLSKKWDEGKHYYVAMSHVAKKLTRTIFYLLKTNTAFVPQM